MRSYVCICGGNSSKRSTVTGLLLIAGNIGGVIVAGLFVDANKPLPAYQQGLWMAYGIIIAILLILMLVTIITVYECTLTKKSSSAAEELQTEHSIEKQPRSGVWNIALSLPQVIAPVLGGPLIDAFTRAGNPVLGFQLLFTMAIVYCVVGTVTVRYIRGVKR